MDRAQTHRETSLMHRNPVQRGLVASPELWHWSSFRAYFLGEAGPVRVNEGDVLKRKIRPPAGGGEVERCRRVWRPLLGKPGKWRTSAACCVGLLGPNRVNLCQSL